MNCKHNEQAFPSVEAAHGVQKIASGMSLRDYFAAQALLGVLAASFMKGDIFTPEQRAHHAYQYADAMLKEREKAA